MKTLPDAPKAGFAAVATREKPAGSIAYAYGDRIYLNLTNRCPTACRFCIKGSWKWRFLGADLKLRSHEPTAAEIWEAIRDITKDRPFKELVFCGYGECTYRLPVMGEVGRKVGMEFPGLRRRLNTIGLGNLIWDRSIACDFRREPDIDSKTYHP